MTVQIIERTNCLDCQKPVEPGSAHTWWRHGNVGDDAVELGPICNDCERATFERADHRRLLPDGTVVKTRFTWKGK